MWDCGRKWCVVGDGGDGTRFEQGGCGKKTKTTRSDSTQTMTKQLLVSLFPHALGHVALQGARAQAVSHARRAEHGQAEACDVCGKWEMDKGVTSVCVEGGWVGRGVGECVCVFDCVCGGVVREWVGERVRKKESESESERTRARVRERLHVDATKLPSI